MTLRYVVLVAVSHREDFYTRFNFQVKVFLETACQLLQRGEPTSNLAEVFPAFWDLYG